MTSRIAPALERIIAENIQTTLRKTIPARCQLLDTCVLELCEILELKLRGHADCFFLIEDTEIISLCSVFEVIEIIKVTITNFSVISFIYDKGALTLSADKLDGVNSVEIHLIGWGTFFDSLFEVGQRLGGAIY